MSPHGVAILANDDITARGRIPGAVWGHGGSDAMHVDDFRNPDDTLRDYQDIVRFWAEVGITPDKRVGFHCGTGWRASETYLAAWLMGWKNITIYDGGWYEWSHNRSNPTERGEPRRVKSEGEPAKAMPAPSRGYAYWAIPGVVVVLLVLWGLRRRAASNHVGHS